MAVRIAISLLLCVLLQNAYCMPRKVPGKSDKMFDLLAARMDKLEETLASQGWASKADVEKLRHEYKTEIKKLRLDHLSEIDKLRREHQIEMVKLQQEHKTKIGTIRRERATEINKLRKELRANQHLLRQDMAETTAHIDAVENKMQRQFDLVSLLQGTNGSQTASGQHHLPNRAAADRPQIMERAVRSMNRIRQADTEMDVAFYVTLAASSQHMGANQIIAFDHVITNIGSSYNPHTGTFVAPVSGTYVFSVTLTTYVRENAHYGLFRNSDNVAKIYINGAENAYDTASQTAVFHLAKGDDVTIKHLDTDHALLGSTYSMFSGFLLKQDYPGSTPVIGK